MIFKKIKERNPFIFADALYFFISLILRTIFNLDEIDDDEEEFQERFLGKYKALFMFTGENPWKIPKNGLKDARKCCALLCVLTTSRI